MKKLLVASIYTPISLKNGWFDIQKKFLDLTTEDYDFGVFCNFSEPEDFPDSVILGQQGEKELRQHYDNGDYQPDDESLNKREKNYHYDIRVAYFKIMNYFKEHADEYENFLLIDCDIFPVCTRWQSILKEKMVGLKRWYAALLRGENFEYHPWLGVFYVRSQYIHEDIADWFPREYENNFGEKYREGGIKTKTHHEGEQIWYPLIRSNVLNLHPFRFGIYNHLFYHHMKGSWNKDDLNWEPKLTAMTRPEIYGYYDHYMLEESHMFMMEHYHKRLMAHPEKFIASLMGVDVDKWFKK